VIFSFNPAQGLIRVRVEVTGPTGSAVVYLGLDTGATATVIRTVPLVQAGYDPVALGHPLQLTTASGVAQAFRFPALSLIALGQARNNFRVIAHNLPPSTSVDGVLGLDFFRGQVLTLDFVKGEITLTTGGPTP